MDLKTKLDALYHRYQRPDFLASDPVEYVHRYPDPTDQEAVAIMAALCAYGGVTQIRASLQRLFSAIEDEAGTPSAWIRDGAKSSSPLWKIVGHRFNPKEDWIVLGKVLGQVWKDHGSVGQALGQHFQQNGGNLGAALSTLLSDWKKISKRFKARPSFDYFLTRPDRGSACKRWMMLLRWMVRQDAIDLGLWNRYGLRSDHLIMPLDTHTGRISQYLGLTQRKALDWRTAQEVTESLRRLDQADPVKYDFALSRLGILDLCQKRLRVEICSQCQLQFHCTYTRGNSQPPA